MDEVDKIQIALEQSRETIAVKIELFENKERSDVLSALRYAARYYHDVFEDFERRKTRCDGENYIISSNCQTLLDFISPKYQFEQNDSQAGMPKETLEQTEIMKDVEKERTERWRAFHKIRELRGTGGRRFKAVAEACIGLVTAELKSTSKTI